MDSKLNTRLFLLVAVAVAVSGALLYNSHGLQPQWWSAWLAPLPLLLIAPRVPLPVASMAAFAAGLIGGTSMWGYHALLRIPLSLKVAALVMPAVAVCAGVLLFRWCCRRGRFFVAALVFPSFVVAYEYLVSLGFGTFGTTAYSQLKNLPVLQLDAVTGLWGVSFVVMLAPAMVAAIVLSSRVARRRLAITFAAVFAGVIGYGILRLSNNPQAEHTVSVGLVASDLPKNTLPEKDDDAMRLMREYAEQVKLLANRGAAIVVIPEMSALVRDTISADVDRTFQEAARENHVHVVAGVLHATSNGTFNEARLYSDAGATEAVYRKHHLVPVVEGRTTPANGISIVHESFGDVGLEICRDMDYADPARRYGQAEVGLVLAPAWDFNIDRQWHGHMAILRGVENGFNLVRVAKQGLLYVSDNRGRILSEVRTSPQQAFTTLIASVPVRHDATLYQMWGDWFAWVDLALLVVLLGAGLIASREKQLVPTSAAAAMGKVA